MAHITADNARKDTDLILSKLEKRLTKHYKRAESEIIAKARKYFESFRKNDERKRELLERGKISEEEYKTWRKNKILYSKRFIDLKEKISAELANVNETALRYINGEIPEIYVINYNGLGVVIEDEVIGRFDSGYSFDLVDADTVRILAAENPDLLPQKRLDIPKDKAWNKKKMSAEVLQGIIQGESIPKIAARMQSVTEMNKDSAIRNARTMVTSAENRGRVESMARAEKDGVILKKEWISSDQPGRTRDWHLPGAFESLVVPLDEPFRNEMGEIMYPGDPSASGANVYNCRCSMGTEIVGFKRSE